jgi:hypothetical protein
MTRFKLKKPGENKKPMEWISWRSQLELRSVNIIAKSGPVTEEKESEIYV